MINCIHCGKELEEIVDTTTSNYNSDRTQKGQHTGDIYFCDDCEEYMIHDHLNNMIREWDY